MAVLSAENVRALVALLVEDSAEKSWSGTGTMGAAGTVMLDGASEASPCTMLMDAAQGERVNVSIVGGTLYVTGNATSPATDDSAVNDLKQFFYHDSGGAHVRSSDGMATVTSDGLEITDADGVSVAEFSADEARVGSEAGTHVAVTSNTFSFKQAASALMQIITSIPHASFAGMVSLFSIVPMKLLAQNLTSNARVDLVPEGMFGNTASSATIAAVTRNGGSANICVTAGEWNGSSVGQSSITLDADTVANFASGTETVTFAAAGTRQRLAVTFPRTFKAAPIVIVCLSGHLDRYRGASVSAAYATTTGFDINVYTSASTAAGTDFLVKWLAFGIPA